MAFTLGHRESAPAVVSDSMPNASTPCFNATKSQKLSDGAQSFFFINATNSAVSQTVFAQKTIRSQAARISASSRIETTVARRQAKRRVSTDLQCSSPIRAKPAVASNMLTIRPSAAMTEWTCDLQTIVRQTFDNAVAEIYRAAIPCDVSALTREFVNPARLTERLMWDCIALLVNGSSELAGRRMLSRPTVAWQRHNLLTSIRDAVEVNHVHGAAIAPVVALLAGWEIVHGEQQAANIHLRALPRLIIQDSGNSDGSNSSPVIAPELLSLPNPFSPPPHAPSLPAGFEFYRENLLLPACLMNAIGSVALLAEVGANDGSGGGGGGLVWVQRCAAASEACRPGSASAEEAARGKEMGALVARHAAVATSMLTTMMRLVLPEEAGVNGDLAEALEAWYAEAMALNSLALVGTVYDEILLWSLAVFVAAVQRASKKQLECVRTLLETLNVQTSDQLVLLLQKYLCPPVMVLRMARVLDRMFDK